MLRTFAGGRVFGRSYGHGVPWVLALHGWMRTHRDFDGVLDGMDAIALDLPGFGATPAPPAGWTTAEYAEWLSPILDELNPGAVVLGHSFGGRVATHLAARDPARVGALILSGVPHLVNGGRARAKPAPGFRLGKALHRHRLIGDERMETLRRRYGSADYRAADGVLREVLVKAVNETYDYQLAAFPGPVELIWGEQDDQAPLGGARAALAACPEGRLVSLPGIGHFTPRDAPAELRAALLRHRPDHRAPTESPHR